jgi:hypothetical protein
MMQRLPNTWLVGLGPPAACVLVLSALCAFLPARVTAQESAARLFAAHALALRTAGVAGDDSAAAVLANMPGAAGVSESLPVLFHSFFANAIVQLGRLNAPAPVALYYNPLLDLALFTLWEKQAGSYGVTVARFLPGERLANPRADVPLMPAWMSTADGPIVALSDITTSRLTAFRRVHPWRSSEAGRDPVTFAAAAADLRAALPRLAWNAVQTTRWTDAEQPWLRPTLARVEDAFAARNPAALTTAAPDTDADTAVALAQLPAGFTAGLALDMTVEAGDADRLIIASLPEDGDIYVLILCRLASNACVLRRFLLISLSTDE